MFMNSCINEMIIMSTVFQGVFISCAAGALVPSLNPRALRDDQNRRVREITYLYHDVKNLYTVPIAYYTM